MMTLDKTEKNGIKLLCCAFSGSLQCDIEVSEEEYLLIFQELQQHAVAALPAELLSRSRAFTKAPGRIQNGKNSINCTISRSFIVIRFG